MSAQGSQGKFLKGGPVWADSEREIRVSQVEKGGFIVARE